MPEQNGRHDTGVGMNLDKPFDTTCQVLFGRPIGTLTEFAPYLSELVEQPLVKKSCVSGKPVFLSRPYYCEGARFAGVEEMGSKPAQLGINDCKDIDSLVAAAAEKFSYCGSKNLGVSMDVLESDMCYDSSGVLRSQNVISSKSVACSNGVRQSEAVFGCQLGGEVGFSMRSQIFFYSKRCFETYVSEKCTDMFFCSDCRNCTECLFCFNQTAARNAIGNVALPKEQYLALKKKLLSEVAEGLAKNRHFPSLFAICAGVGVAHG